MQAVRGEHRMDNRQGALYLLQEARQQQERLVSIEPFLLDLSLRENPVGSRVGQTLEDKLEILPQLREFGLRNIVLGSLVHMLPDEPEIDHDFIRMLHETGADLSGCYAIATIGLIDGKGGFRPDPSMEHLVEYGVHHAVLEIHASPSGMADKYDFYTLVNSLVESIRWLRGRMGSLDNAGPKIFVDIVDGCDAFAEEPEQTLRLVEVFDGITVDGVMIEDRRGTYMPFQVGAYVAALRNMVSPTMTILVHAHAGSGFENAVLIEALLRGANGVWGGLPRQEAASLGELIANLARIGNPHVDRDYRLDRLLPLTASLQAFDDETTVADDVPVIGRNAYRLVSSALRQRADRFMDLPPERLGGRYRYRVSPLVSDKEPVRGRLAEVTGRSPEEYGDPVVDMMLRLMRHDLRAGMRIDYDDPANLTQLYERARRRMKQVYPRIVE